MSKRGPAGTNIPDRVLAALRSGPATVHGLTSRLGANYSAVERAVLRLAHAGKVRRVGVAERARTYGTRPYLFELS